MERFRLYNLTQIDVLKSALAEALEADTLVKTFTSSDLCPGLYAP